LSGVSLSPHSVSFVGIPPETEVVEWLEEVIQQQMDVITHTIQQSAVSVEHGKYHAVAEQQEQQCHACQYPGRGVERETDCGRQSGEEEIAAHTLQVEEMGGESFVKLFAVEVLRF